MKYGICEKCKKESWLETHHILPKSTFGDNEETIDLCPNCHTDYHQKLGVENMKNADMAFHFYFFDKWLYGLLSIILAILGIYFVL
jgi:ribosomal protein L31